MWQLVTDGLNLLQAASGTSIFTLFLLITMYDIPRYYLSAIATAIQSVYEARKPPAKGGVDFVSVVIAGHNEEDGIVPCVLSLCEQSRPPDEIIVVSDGSTDRTPDRLRDLQRRGVIQEAHCMQLRGGKSAALNFAIGRTAGNITVVVDADSTLLDRHALKNLIAPFADPRVEAVAGNVLVRNAKASLIATCQAIEYLICISLGKRAANLTGEIACISGAFGAFRREALERVGGYDAGGSEDADLTLRLREANLKIYFASGAIIYTDVPATIPALVRQRFRWEQYTISYRNRKHGYVLNPFSARFNFLEALLVLDFIIFTVGTGIAFWIYIVWLFVVYGGLAPVVIVTVQSLVLLLETSEFLLAALITPSTRSAALLPYMLAYSALYQPFMRSVRSVAYIREWIFKSSYGDRSVPKKVHSVRL